MKGEREGGREREREGGREEGKGGREGGCGGYTRFINTVMIDFY